MAFEPGALAGTSYLYIDGVEYAVVGSVGYQVSRSVKETLMGQGGVHGFSVKPVAPYIKAQIRDSAGTRVGDFEGMESVSVSLELTSGKRITGNGMWCVNAVEVNSDDATFEVRFEGADVQEG
ncbi:phage tail tube protein [Falsiroseomonas sp. CW058]|uniref:phage tail tube protein n=1 Tax=Falsiroseomonas sp. CW058 TaxID=3388664 RepID=UPI003D32189A